jgi:peptidoglycan/LPS O-acetylase OafA/YrhL
MAQDGAGNPSLDALDSTATGKEHFEVLDGMRGSAALLVVLYHIQGITVGFQQGKMLFAHAYLAVDFFFALSGFVIGYAYDDRWPRMSVGGFFRLRLVRLHPLVILGALLGLASYLFDPFAAGTQNAPLGTILIALALTLFLLPNAPLPNRWTDTHSLNGPAWTLLQEYVANIAYALVLRHLPVRALVALSGLAAILLIGCGAAIGTLDRGYAWENFWMAPVRLAFPFLAGLLIYRVRDRLPRVRVGYVPLTAAMVVAFMLPTLPDLGGVRINGIYEALCVILLFPAIVIAGAHSEPGFGLDRLCRASGHLSYPLYITHFAFMYIWMNYVLNFHPSSAAMLAIAIALIPFTLLIAWAALKLWDLPIRTALRR